jgi:hypothetical protein
LIQKVNAKYLGRDAADIQRDAMMMGELRYEGQDHEKAIERLFEINDDIELFSEEAEGFPIREMARKIIPQTLKPQARLKYVDKGGKLLREQEDIFELCRTISDVLSIEYEVQQQNNRPRSGNAGGNSSRNQGSTEDRKRKDNLPCRKHDGAHKWKDFPNNWRNKNNASNAGTSSNANRSQQHGEEHSQLRFHCSF